MKNFLLERFFPIQNFNWESRSFHNLGERFIKKVEKIKGSEKNRYPSIEEWMQALRAEEDEDYLDNVEI